MDYFSTGGRPFLLQFPHCVSRMILPHVPAAVLPVCSGIGGELKGKHTDLQLTELLPDKVSVTETEEPWQGLLRAHRNMELTAVATEFAQEGGLFSCCGTHSQADLGKGRENSLRPLAVQIVKRVQRLHEMGIVRRGLSVEKLIMSKGDAEAMQVHVIDFGMASTARFFRKCVNGEPSYQAPELHLDRDCDAYLCDAFSIGVSLFVACEKDCPWTSTRPGECKCFDFFLSHSFRQFAAKRKLRGSGGLVVADVMSESLIGLLEGLLAADPERRLTLGESTWRGSSPPRRSVWDEVWLHGNSSSDDCRCAEGRRRKTAPEKKCKKVSFEAHSCMTVYLAPGDNSGSGAPHKSI